MPSKPLTAELSKRNWKIIETCLRLRQKELLLRKGASGDYRIVDIQRVLGKLSGVKYA